MKIERATADDIYHVASRMRARDFDEFCALTTADTRAEMADLMRARYGGREDVLCGSREGRPICIGGTIETRPHVITLLFFATDEFPKIGLPVTRFIRKELFPRYFAAGVHRIEAVAIASYDPIHGWLRALGLQPETRPLRGYGKRGEPFVQFSLVKNVRAPGP